MGTEFAASPLAIAFHDEKDITISYTNPEGIKKNPRWGNECWWTDPPPAHCEPNLCQIGADLCSKMPNDLDVLRSSLSSRFANENLDHSIKETDLSELPRSLLPMMQVIDEIAKRSGIDLKNSDFKGITITFHK